MARSLLIIPTLSAFAITASCTMSDDIEKLRVLRYEHGKQQGAKFCATCHADKYKQWSERSRHALATRSKRLHQTIDKFTNNLILNRFADESVCFSCHGNKLANEGVNCESCHGTVLPGESIEKTHERKFTPRLVKLRKPDFCSKCHQVRNPISGELLSATYSEWQKSQAASSGQTCQSCHMAPREDEERAYHGFDTAVRDATIYKGDLSISNIAFEFPELRMTINNHVRGHSIPAGAGTRVLALELSFKNRYGREIYSVAKTFRRKFAMLPLVGVFPFRLVENTSLKSGEQRRLRFMLPYELSNKIKKIRIVLKMHEVADEFGGNIQMAHWSSKPILSKELNL